MFSELPDGSRGVTPETAMRVADVYACVRVLADAAGSVPLHHFRRTQNGRQRITSGRAIELLERPAPATTQANLIASLVAHLNLYGNAYLGKFKDSAGQVVQLGLLRPDRVTPELKAGTPRYTLTSEHGERSEHGVDDILHIKGLSTDGLIGLSPIRQCRTALRTAEGAGKFIDQYLAEGARPSGILKLPAGGGESADRLRAQFGSRHAGQQNMHKVAVIGGDVEWIAMSATLGDLEFVEQRRISTAEIARIFRIPPWMIGAASGDSLTYSNVEQQQLAFVTHSLRPWLVSIEQAITADPDLCRGTNQYVEFVLEALLRADHMTRANVYEKALNPETGWLTRAEVRRFENLDPEDNVAEQASTTPRAGSEDPARNPAPTASRPEEDSDQ